MRTLKKVSIEPVFVEFIPDYNDLEQGKLYISETYKCAVHLCLCGCGELTVTPLTNTGWTLIKNNGKISLTPSIGNYQFACNSHYIITNNVANFV